MIFDTNHRLTQEKECSRFKKVYGYSLSNSECSQSSKLAFTCSKLMIETLEQGVKYVQS